MRGNERKRCRVRDMERKLGFGFRYSLVSMKV